MRFPALVALLATFVATVRAGDLVVPSGSVVHHSFGLDAVVTSSGGHTNVTHNKIVTVWDAIPGVRNSYETRDYEKNRDVQSALGLEARVHNFAPLADEATLEWYFLAREVPNGQDFIFDSGHQKVDLKGGNEEKLMFVSKPAERSEAWRLHLTTEIKPNGRKAPDSAASARDGTKITGWIVRLVDGGKVLAARASNRDQEWIAWDYELHYPRAEE